MTAHLIFCRVLPVAYSYFEKGCRKKCTWQSWKVLWVAFNSLFIKEFWENDTRGHGHMFTSAKKNNKRRFDSYSVRNNVLIISLLPFGIVASVFFLTAFLEIPVILLGRSSHGKVATAVTSHQCSPSVSHSIHTILWYFVSSLSRRFRLVARFPYAMEKMYVCSASTQNKTSW